MNDIEVWKSYPEFEFIQGSSLGGVRTIDRYVNGRWGKMFVKGHELKQQRMPNGYMRVVFRVNGKHTDLYVHRIIASCFLPNPDNLPQVNHKDCNPTNNYVNNLEWCSRQYNMAYKEKYGTSAAEATKVLRKPLFSVALKTGEVLRFNSQHEAERKIGVASSNINAVLKNRRKQASGHWFCYADDNAVEATRVKLGNKVATKVAKLMKEN